ncbi:hypothetical protein R5W24_003429 [Gemmata sp. JC717]|uniref:hypothetical protein n=1 Tax=Gemmata algarum TaxID=2975278 RepID=UPI0021BAD236|nr:hypothetical protein [Gemmata algarum]MDY3554309.1 hypothetical protein [Gemmata algarum]
MRNVLLVLGAVMPVVTVCGIWWAWARETAPSVEWSADMRTVADGNNAFGLDLYAKLREAEPGNAIFSPYSAAAVSPGTCMSAQKKRFGNECNGGYTFGLIVD